jgi:methionine sulfoxide reductase heme-binding subunit
MAKWIDNRWAPLLLALLAGLAGIAIGLSSGDTLPEQARLAARWTARTAFPFFFITYIASTSLRLWPGTLVRAIMRRRRQWGLGFALAHSIHLVALGYNVLAFDNSRPWFVLVVGGVAYGLMYLMALTSNNWSMRRLGHNWKRLHNIGIHYTWFIFAQGAVGNIIGDDPSRVVTGSIVAPLLFGGLALRLYLRLGRRANEQGWHDGEKKPRLGK